MKLGKLTPALLDRAYREWLDEGLSPATVHKYHSIITAACRQAVKWGWIDLGSDGACHAAEGGAQGDGSPDT